MTKAELRKMEKLEHMVGNGKADEHKRNLLRKKIELQKAKIKTLQAKIDEMQAKVAAEKAKGMTMVDEYNYFVGREREQQPECPGNGRKCPKK